MDNKTVPAKPLRAVTVTVDIAEEPTADAGEVAVIVKSTKLKAAVDVCEREPLIPVIVTVKALAVLELHERVAVPEPDIVPGLIALQLNPAGNGVSESDIVPVKPVSPTTVMVEETN